MMKKLLIIASLLFAPTAFAQDAVEQHSDEHLGGVDDTTGGENAAGTQGGEAHGHDPTEHFNFFNFGYRGHDQWGDKFGDGVMRDPKTGAIATETHTKVIVDPETGKKKTVHEAEPEEEEAMSPPFVLMLLNFAILLFILAKFGGPVARKAAEERHDQIKTALDEAAKLRDQAAKKLAEYETRIKDVDSEVKKLVEGIRADAEADKKRILEAAAVQAATMKRDAELRIAAEIELARAQLTKEVTAAAAGATEKLLREKVTNDDQNKLVTTFITNVAAQKEAR
ncbi:MAG TPA: ATP synthase F0 subunit B [Kofleriaceae bacterium]|nr:ATP synthase F0 subunit B [Kofleriaceae bacterium]